MRVATTDQLSNNLYNQLQRKRKSILWTGVVLTMVGIISLVFPLLIPISLTLFIASIFIATGVISIFNSFSIVGTGSFFSSLFIGLLRLFCGVIIFTNPMIGVMYLTFIIAVLFVLEGAFEMTFAFEVRPQNGWIWSFISSLISIICGIIIIMNLSTSSLWLIGLLFGVNILSSGLALFFISRRIEDLSTKI